MLNERSRRLQIALLGGYINKNRCEIICLAQLVLQHSELHCLTGATRAGQEMRRFWTQFEECQGPVSDRLAGLVDVKTMLERIHRIAGRFEAGHGLLIAFSAGIHEVASRGSSRAVLGVGMV